MRSDLRASRALLAAGLVVTGAIGCQQILGLDQFTKDAAPTCDAGCGDAGADALVDAAPDISLPDVVNPTTSWATWPMPTSPAEVEAGANADAAASFSVAGGVAADSITKLQWNLSASAVTYPTIEDAATYCSSLGSSWRLPTRIELVTVLDSAALPAVAAALAVDGGVQKGFYWTSSYYRPLVGGQVNYWFVDFGTGNVVYDPPTAAYAVCVR